MTEQLYLEDFSGDPVVWFDAIHGIAINTRANTLRVFHKQTNSHWTHDLMAVRDIRQIERISLSAAEFMTSGRGGAKGIGEGVGAAIRNSMEKSKAAKGSGVKIYLKSVEMPSMFFSIPDEQRREAFYEALNQIIDNGYVTGSLTQITADAREFYHRPTPEEIAAKEMRSKQAERRAKSFIPNVKLIAALLVFAAVAIWPTYLIYREMVFGNVGRYPHAPMSEDLTIFFVCWLAISYVFVSGWRFLRA